MSTSKKIVLLILSTAAFFLILNFIPTFKYPLPARIMGSTWKILIILFITVLTLGLAVKKTYSTKSIFKNIYKVWGGIVFVLATLISIQTVLYFSFPLSYGTKSSPSTSVSQPSLLDRSSPEQKLKVSDSRCTFSIEDLAGPLKIVSFNEENILTNLDYKWQLTDYSASYDAVKYIRDKTLAIVLVGTLDQMFLLDFKLCSAQLTPSNFKFNKEHFELGLRSISPNEKYILYEISKGYKSPPHPATENDFTQEDASKNGFWLYNLETLRFYQIRKLPIETDTDNLRVRWEEKTLSLEEIDCPTPGCRYNLENY